jgi:hypothetical protein
VRENAPVAKNYMSDFEQIQEPCPIRSCDQVFTIRYVPLAGPVSTTAFNPQVGVERQYAMQELESTMNTHLRDTHGLWRQKEWREEVYREVQKSLPVDAYDASCSGTLYMVLDNIRTGRWQRVPSFSRGVVL